MADGYINTGTASATSGDATVTFVGVSVTLFRPGNPFFQGGHSGVIESIDEGGNTVELTANWGGSTGGAVAYAVLTIPESSELAASTRTLMQYLDGGSLLSIAQMVGGAAPNDYDMLQWDTSGWVAKTPADAMAGADLSLASLETSGNLEVGGYSAFGGASVVTGRHIFTSPGISEDAGNPLARFGKNGSSVGSVYLCAVSVAGWNNANAALFCPKDSSTSRSINAGGTVNASGADYADYYTKAETCGAIAKGALAGIGSDGLLTDKWADAVAFKFKSTAPCLVGGDNWGNDACIGLERPQPPADDAEGYEAAFAAYASAKTTFDSAVEAARQRVDRMACSGKVPAILSGSFAAGDVVMPAQDGDGIKAVAVTLSLADAMPRGAVGKILTANPSEDQFRALLGPGFAVNPAWNAIIDV